MFPCTFIGPVNAVHDCYHDFGSFCPLAKCKKRILRGEVKEHLSDPHFKEKHLKLLNAEIEKNVDIIKQKQALVDKMEELKNMISELGK
jgi:hypothetical protein